LRLDKVVAAWKAVISYSAARKDVEPISFSI
jgi:hypothetical protein